MEKSVFGRINQYNIKFISMAYTNFIIKRGRRTNFKKCVMPLFIFYRQLTFTCDSMKVPLYLFCVIQGDGHAFCGYMKHMAPYPAERRERTDSNRQLFSGKLKTTQDLRKRQFDMKEKQTHNTMYDRIPYHMVNRL